MSNSYFWDGAAESSAIFEALQEVAKECGPKDPVEAKSEIQAAPAPPKLPRMRIDVAVWTYFFQAGNAIKIGRSTNPRGRVSSFRTANQHEGVLLCFVPEELAAERDLHREFKHIRMQGEWFQATPELHARIDGLREEWRGAHKTFKPRAPAGAPPMPNDTIGKLMWLARNTYRAHPRMRAHLELLREQTINLKKARSDEERARIRVVMAETTAVIDRIQRVGDLPDKPPKMTPVEMAEAFGLRPT